MARVAGGGMGRRRADRRLAGRAASPLYTGYIQAPVYTGPWRPVTRPSHISATRSARFSRPWPLGGLRRHARKPQGRQREHAQRSADRRSSRARRADAHAARQHREILLAPVMRAEGATKPLRRGDGTAAKRPQASMVISGDARRSDRGGVPARGCRRWPGAATSMPSMATANGGTPRQHRAEAIRGAAPTPCASRHPLTGRRATQCS